MEKKENLLMRIKMEEQMKEYNRANVSLVVAVDQRDTIKTILDKVCFFFFLPLFFSIFLYLFSSLSLFFFFFFFFFFNRFSRNF